MQPCNKSKMAVVKSIFIVKCKAELRKII